MPLQRREVGSQFDIPSAPIHFQQIAPLSTPCTPCIPCTLHPLHPLEKVVWERAAGIHSVIHPSMNALDQETVLQLVDEGTIRDSRELCQERGWDHESLVGILKSLESKDMLILGSQTKEISILTSEGLLVLEEGSPEYQVFAQVSKDGSPKVEVEVSHSPSILKH